MKINDITLMTIGLSAIIIVGIIALLVSSGDQLTSKENMMLAELADPTSRSPWSIPDSEITISSEEPTKIALKYYDKSNRNISEDNTPKVNCLINGASVYFDTHKESIMKQENQIGYVVSLDPQDISNSGTEPDSYYSCFFMLCQDDENDSTAATTCFNPENVVSQRSFIMHVQ